MERIPVSAVRIYRVNHTEYGADVFGKDHQKMSYELRQGTITRLAARFIESRLMLEADTRITTIDGPSFNRATREFRDPVNGKDLADFDYWYTERMKREISESAAST